MKIEFGGSLLVGKRKSQRPFHKGLQHVVLKATGPVSLLPNAIQISKLISDFSRRFEIEIVSHGIHDDHVHLAIVAADRNSYAAWSRSVAGRLAQIIPGLRWKFRPYNRLADDADGSDRLLKYIEKNRREGEFMLDAHVKAEQFKNFADRLCAGILA